MRYCKNCGFVGQEVKYENGPGAFLWILSIVFIFVPILLYYLFGRAKAYYGCPRCRSPHMIPCDSPLAPEGIRRPLAPDALSRGLASPTMGFEPQLIVKEERRRGEVLLLCLCLLIFGALYSALTSRSGTEAEPSWKQVAKVAAEGPGPAKAQTVDPPVTPQEQQVLEKEQVLKHARDAYVDRFNDLTSDYGIEGHLAISRDSNTELIFVSDELKVRPNRDSVMQQAFGPSVRRDLCKLGFKTLTLTSGSILGSHATTYTLGCTIRRK